MGPSAREVSERAYQKWVQNGRLPGSDLADWLETETELQLLSDQAQQLAGKALPESEQLLRAILDNSPAVVSVKDVQGRYLLINRRYEALFRVTQKQLGGRTDHDVFPAAIADALRANDLSVLAAQMPQEFEEVLPHETGLHTYISLKFPIAGSNGSAYAICGVSTDITARKQAQRRLLAEHAVTLVLAESAALETATPRILRAVCDSFGWDMGLFWSIDRQANELRCLAVWHAASPLPDRPAIESSDFARLSRHTTFPPNVGLPGQVWMRELPVWIDDLAAGPRHARDSAALAEGLHSVCGFPVRNGDGIIGVFEFCSHTIREPDAEVIDMMTRVTSHVSQFIERKQMEKALHQREREMGLARSIQQRRLPQTAPAVNGFDIGCASKPTQETGGDYLDFIAMPDALLGIAVGDASGHGIAAALLMAETRAYLRALACTDADPGRILAQVNRHLAWDVDGDAFVTLLLAQFNPSTRSVIYSSAGHWPGYLLDRTGKVRNTLRSTTLPLGLDLEGASTAIAEVSLEPGDLLLLLTDGIPEAFSPDGPLFGMERTLNCVRAHRAERSQEIVAALFEAVRDFSQGLQLDDLTVVVVKVAEIGQIQPGGL